MKHSTSIRLSTHVIPIRYEITMRPNLDEFSFSGEEKISIKIAKSTQEITLHAIEVEILSAVWLSGKQKNESHKISYNAKHETVIITFDKSISGKGILDISFKGVLSNALRGFYHSSYTYKGKKKSIATTQFEATDARRAFPCFDEPSMKAVFDVTLIIPKSLTAISNTIQVKTLKYDSEYKVVKFSPTPKMSTYLLAFIVGDFESVKTKTKNGTVIRIFTTPGKTSQTTFALDVAKRSLEFLNNYFAIPYPLPVLDLIAIPDFSAGAMENWGAITFRETVLLFDEKNTPFLNKQHIAEVIAHELVHQWFGNLVTMEWWTHLWLNESFADYMAHVTIDHLFPEWKIWTKFVLGEQSRGLLLDSLHATHPIEVEVNHPDEISQIFDAISYSKGASVLRMLAHYIGDDAFRNGLRLYLKKHSYKNTSSLHLWEALEKSSKKPIRKLMESWIKQPGYPLLSVRADGNKVTYSQQRFTLAENKKNKKKVDQTWIVPIQTQLSCDSTSDMFLLSKQIGVTSVAQDFEYLKLNPGEYAFYRTRYDFPLLARLLVALEEQKLTSIDQLGLLRDLAELAKAGKVTTDIYLETVTYVTDKNSYITWMEIAKSLAEIENVFGTTQTFSNFCAPIFNNLLQSTGFNKQSNDSNARSLLRAIAIRNAAKYGNSDAIEYAQTVFAKHMKGNYISPDLRMAVYTVIAERGGDNEFNQLMSLYKKATMDEEHRRLGSALFAFKSPTLIKRAMEFTLSENVRIQNAPLFIHYGMGNSLARPVVWREVENRWDEISKTFPKGSLISTIISGANFFTNEKELSAFTHFFSDHQHGGSEQAVAKAKESISISMAWSNRDAKLIDQYLKKSS